MAAKTARAAAEQELQRVRREVESLRLSAEVTIPAEFEKAAAELRAKADAAPTIENGEATVRVLEVTAQAWDRMGPKAKELYVIQNLEDIVSTVIEKTHDIEVREVTMLDRGDGSSLASYAAAFPQTVAAILQSLSATTGIDVHQILSGDASGTTPSRASLPSTSGLQGGR